MLRNWLRNFMIGRYGPDQLYVALFILALALMLLSNIKYFGFLSFFAFAVLFIAMFRMFSRNIVKRRAENDRFLRFYAPIKNSISGKGARKRDNKDFKFFKCPGCKNLLRVPKGKGKIQITCPRCGERFEKKT